MVTLLYFHSAGFDGWDSLHVTQPTDRQTDRHPFNGLFSRTTWISRHQKCQTNLDFDEARDAGAAVASAG